MRYSIKLNTWKEKKNGFPDESKVIGDYYSLDAAEADADIIEFRLVCAGYSKIHLEIIENKGE